MIGIIVMGQRQMKIIKRRDRAEHRKYHLKTASKIREQAEIYRDEMYALAREALGYVTGEAAKMIDLNYNNMLAEAIAEENSKCMESHK